MTRQELISQIVTTLSNALSNDFLHIRDFETNWNQDELPALSVFDTEASHELKDAEDYYEDKSGDYDEGNVQLNRLTVTLQIFVKSGTRAQTLRGLFNSVNAVIKVNRTWNGYARWTKPIRTQIEVDKTNPETTNFEIIGGSITLELGVMSESFNF